MTQKDTAEAEVAPPEAVRPKSSKRKARSTNVESKARKPLQARSLQRFELIISTLEAMLQTSRFEDISFYDIAERAGVSPASISYFFPTMTALRIELIQRYFRASAEFHAIQGARDEDLDPDAGWQDNFRTRSRRYRDYLHANRHIAQISLGPMMDIEVSRVSAEENDTLAVEVCEFLAKRYVMPEIPGLEKVIVVALTCTDAIWARSFAVNGEVTDEAFDASMSVAMAYLRTVLPERMALRRD